MSGKPELDTEYSNLETLLRTRLVPGIGPSLVPARRQFASNSPKPVCQFFSSSLSASWLLEDGTMLIVTMRWSSICAMEHYQCLVLSVALKMTLQAQGAGGGWAKCHWDHVHQNYDCTTSEGEFFHISGKKIRKRCPTAGLSRVGFSRSYSPQTHLSVLLYGCNGRTSVRLASGFAQ